MSVNVMPINLGAVKSFLLVGGKKRLVLVDTGNPDDGERIARKVEEAGYRPSDISLIILTHGHRDHVGGVSELVRISGAKVVIGKDDAPLLKGKEAPGFFPVGLKGRILKSLMSVAERMMLEEEGKADYPEMEEIDEEEVSLQGFGIKGKIINTPGHTSGSLSVLLQDGSVIVGDLVMGRFFTFGGASYPVFASDMGLLKHSIEKILKFGPGTIYVSHGGPYGPEDLENLL